MLMFVPTLVMVTTALGTTAPVASFTSPVIVAVSCCASAVNGQANNNTKQIVLLMQRENGLNISFLLLGSRGRTLSLSKVGPCAHSTCPNVRLCVNRSANPGSSPGLAIAES